MLPETFGLLGVTGDDPPLPDEGCTVCAAFGDAGGAEFTGDPLTGSTAGEVELLLGCVDSAAGRVGTTSGSGGLIPIRRTMIC